MPTENIHHRKEKRRYTFIWVSSDESKTTRTFSVGRLGFISCIIGSFVVIAALVYSLILYTPVRTFIPIHNVELEERYSKQIVEIQNRLRALIQEMSLLNAYNLRLRNALGEKVATKDTTAFVEHDSVSTKSIFDRIDKNEMVSNEDQLYKASVTRQKIDSIIEKNVAAASGDKNRSRNFGIEFPLTMPTDGFFTRGFDPQQNHFGIDIAGQQGNSVVAAADGEIVFAGWTYDYGFTIVLAHDRGYLTVYKHNQTIMKNTAATVKRGELIALLGNTGVTSSGPHLHFEVWKNGVPENPINYLLTTQ